ncbi:MAG: 5'-nucleotidase C-terminal domain-containing protein, partial [Inhella sp.]
WLARQPAGSTPHPAYAALRRLGYDAANLGNHEFDFGLPFLRRSIATAGLPVLNANLLDARSGRPAFRATLMIKRRLRDRDGRWHQLRIGVIGLAPPQTLLWNRAQLGGDRPLLRAQGLFEAAQQWIPRLRRQGADLVVVLAHSGIGSDTEQAGQLLALVPGIDALLLGHEHGEFPGSAGRGRAGVDGSNGLIHGVPALMPGRWGDHLGVLDLELERRQGRWVVASARSELRAVRANDGQSAPSDVALRDWLWRQHEAVRDWIATPLADSAQPLHAHFALWQPSRLIALVQQAQLAWLQPRLVGSPWADLPLLSAAAPLRTATTARPDGATDIAAGPLSLRHLVDIYPYANTLKLLRINGAELREWLERSASQFQRLRPDGPPTQALLDPGYPGYNFDQIAGLDVEIDVSQPRRYDGEGRLLDARAWRISSLRWQGKEVRDDQWFLLATNSYRFGGGGGYPHPTEDRLVLDLADEARGAVADYLRQRVRLDLPEPEGWRLKLPPGIEARLPLPAAARRHLSELRGDWRIDEEDQALPLRWRPAR